MIPTVHPHKVSAPAKAIYFYEKYVPSKQRALDAFSEAEQNAAKHELLDAGLVYEVWGSTPENLDIRPLRLHKDFSALNNGFTGKHAERKVDEMYAEISFGTRGYGDALLASLMGVTRIDTPDSSTGRNAGSLRIALRHQHLTDREHDASYVADFTIANASLKSISGAGLYYEGLLISASMYPWNTDSSRLLPRDFETRTQVAKADRENEREYGFCQGSEYHASRLLAPYSPPRLNIADITDDEDGEPPLVTVALAPVRSVDERGRPIR